MERLNQWALSDTDKTKPHPWKQEHTTNDHALSNKEINHITLYLIEHHVL